MASLRPIAAPGEAAVPCPDAASAQTPGRGAEWRQEPPGIAILAANISAASNARAIAGTTRRASAHPQHELQFAPAPLARD